MTPLNELRRLIEAATPGDWGRTGGSIYAVDGDVHWQMVQCEVHADAALIVALVNSATEILDRLEAAERVLAEQETPTKETTPVNDNVMIIVGDYVDTPKGVGRVFRIATDCRPHVFSVEFPDEVVLIDFEETALTFDGRYPFGERPYRRQEGSR